MPALLERVTRVLRDANVPFVMIGATAMAAHGVSRATHDIDLLTTHSRCLDPSLWAALSATGANIDIRPGDEDDPLRGVVRIKAPTEQPIDLVIGRGAWQSDLIQRARSVEFDDLVLPIATAADLILLKLYAGGVQDRWDIQQLIAVSDAGVRDEVEANLAALPPACATLWTQIQLTLT
jgi:hypothetical protein